ncbi:MAG TPA: hypothetical protein VIT45_16795 [Allosphingosinicella sp.]
MSIAIIAIVAAAMPAPGTLPVEGGCMRVEKPLAEGDFAVAGDVTIAGCGDEAAKPGFRYDPVSRLVRASRALEPGEIVPAVSPAFLAGIRPGQRILLSTRIGAVTIDRQVEAVVAAPAGRPVFVRADDGKIFAIPYPEAVQ